MKLDYRYDRNAWKIGLTAAQQKMARAVTKTFRQAAKEIEQRGRAEIARGGLSARWRRAFFVRAKPRSGYSLDAKLRGYHRIGYANVFERGTVIHPKNNLLWVPLPTAPRLNRRRLTPRAYVKQIGPLHSINNPGKRPLLAGDAARAPTGRATVGALKTGARRRGAGKSTVSVPIFVGLDAARIRDRLDIDRIYRTVKDELPSIYRRMIQQETR